MPEVRPLQVVETLQAVPSTDKSKVAEASRKPVHRNSYHVGTCTSAQIELLGSVSEQGSLPQLQTKGVKSTRMTAHVKIPCQEDK